VTLAADPEAAGAPPRRDESSDPAPDADATPSRRPGAWRWAALFAAAYMVLGLVWVVTNPPAAAPDEADHLIKAIGMGRLDIGDDVDEPLPAGPPLVRRNLSITRVVDVPGELSPDGYTCFAFQPEVTADCQPDGSVATTDTVESPTPIGAYPPFAYPLMGVAARLADSPDGAFLLARLVALVTASAAVFVGAWFLVREVGRWALLGAFVALSPMAVFAAASVTTSGLEIAAGFAVGAVATVCIRDPAALVRPRTHYTLAGVGSALVLSRQMGAVALAVLLLITVACCWRQALQALREHRASFVVLIAALGTSVVAVVLWERAYDHPTDTGSPLDLSALDPFVNSGQELILSSIGRFGWLDTPLPIWAWTAWLAVGVVLCGMALVLGDARQRLALAAGLVAVIGVTFASYSSVFFPVGAGSQGRHMLPLLAFCPTFAGVVIVERLRSVGLGDAARSLFVGVAGVVGLVQFVALWTNGRRYAVGLSGPLLFIDDARWTPAGGWVPWLVLAAGGAAGLAALALASRPPAVVAPTVAPIAATASGGDASVRGVPVTTPPASDPPSGATVAGGPATGDRWSPPDPGET
jgi:Predicted membrane protein (DUF2142)